MGPVVASSFNPSSSHAGDIRPSGSGGGSSTPGGSGPLCGSAADFISKSQIAGKPGAIDNNSPPHLTAP